MFGRFAASPRDLLVQADCINKTLACAGFEETKGEPLDRLIDGNEDAHERDEDFCGVVGVDMHWEERIERTEALDGIEEDIAVNAMVQIQFIRPPTTSLVEVLNLQRSR